MKINSWAGCVLAMSLGISLLSPVVIFRKVWTRDWWNSCDDGVLMKRQTSGWQKASAVSSVQISQVRLHLLASLMLVLFYNSTFFQHVLAVYPLTWQSVGFLVSLSLGLAAVLMLLLTLIGWRFSTKPVLTLIFLLSSVTAYFMNTYDVVIDHTMIKNIVRTNYREAFELLSLPLLGYVFMLGIVPATFVARVTPFSLSWRMELLSKAMWIGGCLLVIFSSVLLFSKYYVSFFRENESLRYYANPAYVLYSATKYLRKTFTVTQTALRPLGTDACIAATATERKLIVLVVGESARSDRFALNGYHRQTNPLLSQEEVISFSQMYSCGTSTAFSVPCMFSVYPREQFNEQKGKNTENLLDVLRRVGVHVLWRDNNSNSTDVAGRVLYQDYKQPKNNPICDVECRDEGMLLGLQEYIDIQRQGDIMIVLHQMGNHGPAYYKRYPAEFERFTPVCSTNQLNQCTNEEVGNAYDNAILYTDAFLAKVIALLKTNGQNFRTAMVFISDHGESLGEYGIYLHGLPYTIAPENQKHIASVFWFGDRFQIDRQASREKAGHRFSHDNLFHTILGLFKIETSVYDKQLDMLHEETKWLKLAGHLETRTGKAL